MPDLPVIEDSEFSARLAALFVEAEEKIESGVRRPVTAGDADGLRAVSKEAVSRAGRVHEDIAGRDGRAITEVLQLILDRVDGVRDEQADFIAKGSQAIEQKNALNRAMFDALYGELKSYKDAYLHESLLKPVIRDIISIYDGTVEVGRQMDAVMEGAMLHEEVRTLKNNVEHHAHYVLEVLERLEVTLIPLRPGKLDMLTQRAVDVVLTEAEEENQFVAKVLKRGFMWRERVIRPEEVVIKKWKDS